MPMSLSTRCPSCDTQFRLVPDQLKISHGWVRCGQCAEVFDASQRLIELADDEPSQLAAPPVGNASSQAPTSPPTSEQQATENATKNIAAHAVNTRAEANFDQRNRLLAAHQTPQDELELPIQPSAAAGDFTPKPTRQDSAQTSPSPLSGSASYGGERDDFARELEAMAARSNANSGWTKGQTNSRFDVESVLEWKSSRPELDADDGDPFGPSKPEAMADALDNVSFVRKARRQAFWRHPGVRAMLLLLCLGLGALLAAQWVVHERNRLVHTQPQWQPYIAQLCTLAGCRIEPVQRIEAIAIESSSFSKARSDAQQELYRLSFTIKNNAQLPIALPALELTLTDLQDSPVLRRSLTPSDWGARGQTAPAGGELSASVAIAVTLGSEGVAAGRVSGYRLLAYYP
jgi:predicted Zn finger-like uncharacterized protein